MNGASFTQCNPATGQPVREYRITTPEEVVQAVARSKEAEGRWQGVSLKRRAAILRRVARVFLDRADELARLVSTETGKPLKDALETDVTIAASILNYYAANGPKALGQKRLPFDGSFLMGRIHYERRVPLGTAAVVSPWNFPVAIPVSGLAAALMAGNTVILKPSELTPGCGIAIGDIFREIFEQEALPQDIVQVLTGDGTTGEALINADIDYCIFTGSTRTGYGIREALARRNIGCSLELGGSCPMIVLGSASDLDAVTTYALWSRFVNSGQACAAVKRLYVPESHYDEIVALLRRKIGALVMGDPDTPGVHLGPLISEAQRNRLAEQVEDAVRRGATVETGGKTPDRPGWFYSPTLLTQVPEDARILLEETFGPVLPVIPYKTTDEAVRKANATPYGLTASVFGEPDEASRVAQKLEAGLVAVNDVAMTDYVFSAIPWSGWKQSGPGVSHSIRAVLDATRSQIVTVNLLYLLPVTRKQPWHFGNGDDPAFSRAIMNFMGGQGLCHKLNPAMLAGLWRHRSSKKI